MEQIEQQPGTAAIGGLDVIARCKLSRRAPLGLSWPLVVAVIAFAASLRPALLNDPDVYWHVATARWMLEHLAIPSVDTFSSTMTGQPWIAHEWLSELILGAAYALGGWGSMAILASGCFAAAMAILCRYLLRHLEPIYALFVVAAAGAMVMTHLLARPHALVLPLMTLWGIILVQAREAGGCPRWHHVLLMALWANLHASFVLGIGLAAAFAFEAAWEAKPAARREVVKAWSFFLLLVMAAAVATPFGIDGILFPLLAQGNTESANLVAEWKSPNFHAPQPLEIATLVVGAAFLWRGIRLPAVRLVLLLGLLHLALKHARHAEILGLLAPLILAKPVALQWKASTGPDTGSHLDDFFASLTAPARPLALGIGLALLAFSGWARNAGELKPPQENTPDKAIQAALAVRPAGNVLNDYNFGGYLIYVGIPTFVDGRGEPFGDRFIMDFHRAVTLARPDSFMQLLDQKHIGWTLLEPSTAAVALLDHLPGWRRVYSDKTAVVHVRTGATDIASPQGVFTGD